MGFLSLTRRDDALTGSGHQEQDVLISPGDGRSTDISLSRALVDQSLLETGGRRSHMCGVLSWLTAAMYNCFLRALQFPAPLR